MSWLERLCRCQWLLDAGLLYVEEARLLSSDASSAEACAYGAVAARGGKGSVHTALAAGVLPCLQLLVWLVSLWLLWGARMDWDSKSERLPTAKNIAASPAATTTSSGRGEVVPARCSAYSYPQCEAALQRLLHTSGANRRCQAFEQLKSEGDYFQFPYSATRQERCMHEGCCGCSGQCSKCPPLLPECSSWRLDGAWKVSFRDGSMDLYRFDASGHVEVEALALARGQNALKGVVEVRAGVLEALLDSFDDDGPGGAFKLDLYRAAPQIFPRGAFETFTAREGLTVERHLPGANVVSGHGVKCSAQPDR